VSVVTPSGRGFSRLLQKRHGFSRQAPMTRRFKNHAALLDRVPGTTPAGVYPGKQEMAGRLRRQEITTRASDDH